jgi:hypothetical protein
LSSSDIELQNFSAKSHQCKKSNNWNKSFYSGTKIRPKIKSNLAFLKFQKPDKSWQQRNHFINKSNCHNLFLVDWNWLTVIFSLEKCLVLGGDPGSTSRWSRRRPTLTSNLSTSLSYHPPIFQNRVNDSYEFIQMMQFKNVRLQYFLYLCVQQKCIWSRNSKFWQEKGKNLTFLKNLCWTTNFVNLGLMTPMYKTQTMIVEGPATTQIIIQFVCECVRLKKLKLNILKITISRQR